MTFIEILENSETRSMVEGIEDTISSLRSYPDGEPTLEGILANQVQELREATGFEYEVSI